MSSESTKRELLAGVAAYNNMLSDRGQTVDQLVAKALAELTVLKEERNLTNQQLFELNDRTMRTILFGGKPISPRDRKMMKQVFERLAAIFSK